MKAMYLCSSGKDQVAFGVVPLTDAHQSLQSAKSVRPLTIANCREKRLVTFKKLFMKDKALLVISSQFSEQTILVELFKLLKKLICSVHSKTISYA